MRTRGGGVGAGPHTWTRFAPEAGGERQSPINIDTQRAQYDPSLETPYLGGEAREFMAGAGSLRYLGGALPGSRAALFNYARGFRLEQPNDLGAHPHRFMSFETRAPTLRLRLLLLLLSFSCA